MGSGLAEVGEAVDVQGGDHDKYVVKMVIGLWSYADRLLAAGQSTTWPRSVEVSLTSGTPYASVVPNLG